MFEPFEEKGWWWLPGAEEGRLSGTLSFEPEGGLVLRTLGEFQQRTQREFPTHPLLLGETAGGKDVALLQNQLTSVQMSMPRGTAQAEYSSAVFLANEPVTDQTRFWSLEADVPDLLTWITPCVFKSEPRIDAGPLLTFSPPAPLGALFPGDTEATSAVQVSVDGRVDTRQRHNTYDFSYMPVVRLTFRAPLNLPAVLALHRSVMQFLEMGSRSQLYASNMRLYLTPHHSPGTGRYVTATMQQAGATQATRPRDRLDLLFTYDDVSDRFSSLMPTWLRSYDEVAGTLELYRQLLYSTVNHQHAFLISIFSLEAYYRDAVGRRPVDEQEFSRAVASVLAVIGDESIKALISNRLRYANELPLRDKLSSLVGQIPRVGNVLHITPGFMSKAVASRNALAHQTKNETKRVWKQAEEYKIPNIQLKLFLECVIMSHLGFQYEELVGFLNRNRIAKGLMNLFSS